jgi:hypothetical protein
VKPSELKRIVNKEFSIDTLRAFQEIIEDRVYFIEKAMDLGTRPQIKGFMRNLKEALKQLQEEKPGLWANIRAKRARGEKPAHKNSNAHKDAVKAGKKINKMSERIRFLSPEKQKANDAAFDRRMATLKDLEKGIKLHKAGKISDEELHNLKLKAGTISADSKFTKK